MSKLPIFGTCRLCGLYTKLSFEHVPPRAAFNDRPVLLQHGESLINADLDNLKGRTSQRGTGSYSFCDRCNNNTGRWYGNAFVDWAHQGMRVLYLTQGKPSLYYTFHIFPLRVIKQIICMFFSANGEGFRQAHPGLVRFVLNRQESGMNPWYKIYAYFNAGNRSRQTGTMSTLNFNTGKIRVISEIAFPPMGYLMTFDSEPPDDRLVDISFMAQYRYNDWKHVSLRLPVLPIYTYFAGDYRDRDTVLREAAQNL